MNQTPVKVRRKFDETFKREAVNNWLASRKSAEVIAQELGISAMRTHRCLLGPANCANHDMLEISVCAHQPARHHSFADVLRQPGHLAMLAYKHAKNTFTIPGLGKLVWVNRKARVGRNPATGETIQIKAKRVVEFRVAKAAKDAILGVKK
jgi:Bacterial DNA-binding protein